MAKQDWSGGRSPEQNRRLARIPEDKREELRAGITSLLGGAAGMTPGVGDAMTAQDAYDAASEENYGTAALLAALTAIGLVPGVGDMISGAGRTALRNVDMLRRPKVENVVVWPDLTPPESIGNIISGRPMYSRSQATHASRDMTEAELYDMHQRGYMLPSEEGAAFGSPQNPKKWFSPRDKEGIFGRPWRGRGGQTVRLPIDKLPPNRAVRAGETQVFDKVQGRFVPFDEFMEDFLRGGPPNLSDSGYGARRK